MNPDLDRLIRLQQIESAADDARRRISDHPQRLQALDERVAAAREALTGAKAVQAEAMSKRRAEEKEVSTIQARLAKYKDQLLEVKTNREYQAMLHEIETAQTEIRTREDRILESMMEADELSAGVKKAEAALKDIEKAAGAERQLIEQEVAALQAEMDRTGAARDKLAAEIDRQVLAVYEQVARNRKGIGISEARNGTCTICHVKLRPQMFNEVLRNDSIIQCDHCRRILFFSGDNTQAAAAQAPAQPTLE
jgi:uncharacterized protein